MDVFQRYERTIEWIVHHCPEPDKFAHTYAGIGLWVLSGLILRRPLSSLLSLVPVVALELANEAMDRMAHGAWHWHDTLGDMAATWFWPFALCLCLRSFPSLSQRKSDLAPPFEDDVDRTGTAVPPVGSANGDDVGGVLAGGKPV